MTKYGVLLIVAIYCVYLSFHLNNNAVTGALNKDSLAPKFTKDFNTKLLNENKARSKQEQSSKEGLTKISMNKTNTKTKETILAEDYLNNMTSPQLIKTTLERNIGRKTESKTYADNTKTKTTSSQTKHEESTTAGSKPESKLLDENKISLVQTNDHDKPSKVTEGMKGGKPVLKGLVDEQLSTVENSNKGTSASYVSVRDLNVLPKIGGQAKISMFNQLPPKIQPLFIHKPRLRNTGK